MPLLLTLFETQRQTTAIRQMRLVMHRLTRGELCMRVQCWAAKAASLNTRDSLKTHTPDRRKAAEIIAKFVNEKNPVSPGTSVPQGQVDALFSVLLGVPEDKVPRDQPGIFEFGELSRQEMIENVCLGISKDRIDICYKETFPELSSTRFMVPLMENNTMIESYQQALLPRAKGRGPLDLQTPPLRGIIGGNTDDENCQPRTPTGLQLGLQLGLKQAPSWRQAEEPSSELEATQMTGPLLTALEQMPGASTEDEASRAQWLFHRNNQKQRAERLVHGLGRTKQMRVDAVEIRLLLSRLLGVH